MKMTHRKMETQLNLQPPLFLRTVEVLNVLYLITLSLLSLIFFQRVQAWPIIVVGNALVIALILVLARTAENHQQRNFRILRDWLPAPLILLTFKETYLMVHPIHPVDYDSLLIDLDRLLFGVDPTRWLAQFSHPVITEYLQIIYSTFYILPLLLGYELYRQQRSSEFQYAFFVIVYGFYLSYVGYFLLPALGPRFTLHDFQSLDQDLPGVFFTKYIRLFINTGENIPPGAADPSAFAQRDTFPSGHAEVTLIIMYLSTKYGLKSQWFFYPVGISLIISTVYLRYHYVVDLIAGALLMLFTVMTAPAIDLWWRSYSTRK
ncbi:MAG: phosphatase PAP2 family protein [Bacteroidota bacterium]